MSRLASDGEFNVAWAGTWKDFLHRDFALQTFDQGTLNSAMDAVRSLIASGDYHVILETDQLLICTTISNDIWLACKLRKEEK